MKKGLSSERFRKALLIEAALLAFLAQIYFVFFHSWFKDEQAWLELGIIWLVALAATGLASWLITSPKERKNKG